MKAGDIISEEHGLQFELKSLLGKGLWSKTFLARAPDGVQWVLKIPLSASDFPSGQENQAQRCRTIAIQYGEMLTKIKTQDILCPNKVFISTSDVPILVFKHHGKNLEQKLRQRISFQELIGICIRIVDALDALPLPLRAHGNLHPRNIFLMDRDRVVLSDPIVPIIKEHYEALNQFRRQYDPCFPPEVHTKKTSDPSSTIVDTYCVAATLFRGLTKGQRLSLNEGFTKDIRARLHESIMNLLQQEVPNPLFHDRLCSQLIQFLNRALSVKTSPSPPYRFSSLNTFQTRLGNIYDLIEPSVTYVGQIILARSPGDIIYQTNEPILFSSTIECTPKIDDIDEIACGVRLIDQTHNERIKGYDLGYSVHSHPSGRLRFDFSLGTLNAARYTVKVAFKIRGSSAEVRTMEKDFEVEPAAGWVPPSNEHREVPIILTPDSSQLQVLIDAQDEDDSSDITEDLSESVFEAPPLSLVSNSEPESFFPSDERVDDESWNPQHGPPVVRTPTPNPKPEPKEPQLIIRPISPEVEPSSYEEPSYTFSIQNINDIEVRTPEENIDDELSEQEESVANPFGTTWEASQSHISEEAIPDTLWESSESEEDGDFIDLFKTKITEIRQEPYYFFVAISLLVIVVLVLITINI